MIELSRDERVMIWEFLQNHFSPQDLQNLTYRLGLKEGEIEYKNLSQFARDLIGHFERRELLVELLAGVHYHTPNWAIARLLSQYARRYNQKLLVIRIQEDAPLDWDAIRAALAGRLGRKLSQILAAGWLSKHDLLFVVVPANAANDAVRAALEDPAAGGYTVLGLGAFDELDRSSPGAWPPQPPAPEEPTANPPNLPPPDPGRTPPSFVQRAVELAEAYYGAALLRPDSAQAQQIWGELIQLFTQNQPASGAAVQELEPARHRLEALAAQPHGPESDRQARQRKLLEDDYNRAWRQWWSTVSLRAAIDLDLIDLRRRNLPGAKIPLSHLEKQRLATLEQQYQQATADIEAAKQELDRLGKE